MANFSISVRDLGTSSALQKLIAKTKDFRSALDEAGLYMERETKLNFAREQSPEGDAWAGLAESTLRYKRTSSILRETGSLVASIAKSAASSTEVRITAGTAYGIFHQEGTSKMPARPFIGLSDKHRQEITRIFERHLEL